MKGGSKEGGLGKSGLVTNDGQRLRWASKEGKTNLVRAAHSKRIGFVRGPRWAAAGCVGLGVPSAFPTVALTQGQNSPAVNRRKQQ
jgi:hypothetical protein